MIPYWTAIPFGLLLLCIAILPLAVPHFWEQHRNKAIVGTMLSLPVLGFLVMHEPVEIWRTLEEYFSFIVLIGSLYVISGGIALIGDLKATPKVNTAFLVLGALLANFMGTTGASMVLIRAFLKTNSERRHTAHLPLFFIFVVSNCGGMLTPLGDPPLFLGFLRGVPFFWTLKLFPIWAFVVGLILLVFFFWDSWAYRREQVKDIVADQGHIEPLRLLGGINLVLVGGVMMAAFLPSPLRECVMVVMVLISLKLCPKKARQINRFGYGPIIEVAVLFAAIFVTMVPALMLLREHGPSFGVVKPWQFFWLTGALSSFLDNAPTYLTFLSLAQGLGLSPDVVGVPTQILAAISAGAVCMGANSYIGNGPNFMVKAITEETGMKTPSFFGYMLYAALVLLPIFGLVHLVFF